MPSFPTRGASTSGPRRRARRSPSGVDVVYQGVLVADGWRGVADFLVRQPDGSYEALDTKLARHAKPAYILQLCFYSEQLARLQGREPEHIHVLLGNGELQSFRPREFDAYARRVRARLEQFVAAPPPTEPYPCDHCGICEFNALCEAGGTRSTTSAASPASTAARSRSSRPTGSRHSPRSREREHAPPGLNPETFEKLRRQARLQLSRRETGEPVYELLDPQPARGLALLPDASPGDLFFDIEGDPFWDEQGSLEYLWGVLDTDGAFDAALGRRPRDRAARVRGFVDRVHERLAARPGDCTSTTTRPTRSPRSAG